MFLIYDQFLAHVVRRTVHPTGCLPVSMFLIYDQFLAHVVRLQCFDAVGWAAGRASGL